MKIKVDFITNSSSSSFVILRSDLTPLQELMIIDHIETALMIAKQYPEYNKDKVNHWDSDSDFGYVNKNDAWDITVTDDEIKGDVSMDNFDMMELLKVIGVPYEKINYG